MAHVLPVPWHRQLDDGYCLAACAQMVLEYWGVQEEQARLAQFLGIQSPFGAPASNILRLRSFKMRVEYGRGDITDLKFWLDQRTPPIVFIQAGELPHWRGHRFQHAVVVVGIEMDEVLILDPAASDNPIKTPIGDFRLAWDALDTIYAVVTQAA